MKKALVLIDDGFQEAEVIYPYYRLIEAGFATDLAGEKEEKEYKGKMGGYSFITDVAVDKVNVSDYQIIIIPGGYAPDKMRTKEGYVRIIREAFEQEKIVGSICHGAQLLVEADVLKGRKMTCYIAVRKDVINAGAEFEDLEVVRDRNLITSRKPADLPAFMRTIVEAAQ